MENTKKLMATKTTQTKQNNFAMHRGGTTPTLLWPPQQQPRLILFVEALVVKGASCSEEGQFRDEVEGASL